MSFVQYNSPLFQVSTLHPVNCPPCAIWIEVFFVFLDVRRESACGFQALGLTAFDPSYMGYFLISGTGIGLCGRLTPCASAARISSSPGSRVSWKWTRSTSKPRPLSLSLVGSAPHAGSMLMQRLSQRVQGTNMVQSMVSVVVISLMVWVSIPHIGTKDPLGLNSTLTFALRVLQ